MELTYKDKFEEKNFSRVKEIILSVAWKSTKNYFKNIQWPKVHQF